MVRKCKNQSSKKYEFRIRFHLQDVAHLKSRFKELTLLKESSGVRIRIKGEIGVAIENSKRLAVIGGPFATINEAAEAANRTRISLLIWAAK